MPNRSRSERVLFCARLKTFTIAVRLAIRSSVFFLTALSRAIFGFRSSAFCAQGDDHRLECANVVRQVGSSEFYRESRPQIAIFSCYLQQHASCFLKGLACQTRSADFHRADLLSIKACQKSHQLGMFQTDAGSRCGRSAETIFLENLRIKTHTAAIPPTMRTLSDRFDRNTWSAPENGSRPPALTKAIRDAAPLRRETGWQET